MGEHSQGDGKAKGTVMENGDDLAENLVLLVLVTTEYTEGAL